MWTKQYGVDGVYQQIDTESMFVPVDVINHHYNKEKDLHEFLKDDPIVVFRHLELPKEHKRYAMQLSEFNLKFIKV